MVDQGDRSCAKARRAFAEKFGLGTNNTWYVLHNTQLNVQICKYVQKQSICRENSEHVLDESFYGHFCPRRNAANFCHPVVDQDLNIVSDICEKWPYAAYK